MSLTRYATIVVDRKKLKRICVVYTFNACSSFSQCPITSQRKNDAEVLKAGNEKLIWASMMTSENQERFVMVIHFL